MHSIRTTISLHHAARRTRRVGGFTFVELMIGMTITALVAAALAAFSFAMTKNWTDSEASQSVELTANQASLRIMRVMKNAKSTGKVHPGSLDGSAERPASIVFWKSDDNGDNIMQTSEIASLEHDTDADTIVLYEVVYPATYSQSQIDLFNSVTLTMADIADANAATSFKDAVKEIDPSYQPRPLAANVTGALFEMHNATSETQQPSFIFTLRVEKNDVSSIEYGTATLRGAATPDE